MPDRMPDRICQNICQKICQIDMPDRMPEDMSDRMPEDMPDRMPEDLPDRMPEHMPEDMPDRMPEDMSDRMPEDLPVRKCINVMVGITRSKVIFNTPRPWRVQWSCCWNLPKRLIFTHRIAARYPLRLDWIFETSPRATWVLQDELCFF